MAQQIVFATQFILCSQGWMEPAHLIPHNDMPEEELKRLHDEGKIGHADYHSPLAKAVHAARPLPRQQATEALAHAMATLSKTGEEVGEEPDLELDVDEPEEPAKTDPAPAPDPAPTE